MINLIAFIGPSAVGKSTLRDMLNLGRIVTYTSRAPRDGEQDGVDYHFTSKEMILSMHRSNDLLEFTEYNGNCYATSVASICELSEQKRCSTIIVDYSGAKVLKERLGNSVFIIGVRAPYEECESRMILREEKNIKDRLNSFESEIDSILSISDIIINNAEVNWVNSPNIISILRNGIDSENADTLSKLVENAL